MLFEKGWTLINKSNPNIEIIIYDVSSFDKTYKLRYGTLNRSYWESASYIEKNYKRKSV